MPEDPKSLSIEEAQSRLRELIQRIQQDEPVLSITDEGDDRAVLVSAAEYQGMLERIRFLEQAAAGLADIAAGRTEPWSDVRDELLRKLEEREFPTSRADSA